MQLFSFLFLATVLAQDIDFDGAKRALDEYAARENGTISEVTQEALSSTRHIFTAILTNSFRTAKIIARKPLFGGKNWEVSEQVFYSPANDSSLETQTELPADSASAIEESEAAPNSEELDAVRKSMEEFAAKMSGTISSDIVKEDFHVNGIYIYKASMKVQSGTVTLIARKPLPGLSSPFSGANVWEVSIQTFYSTPEGFGLPDCSQYFL